MKNKTLTTLITASVFFALSSPMVFAAENENVETSDTSTNPITGTTTTTKEAKYKKTHPNGGVTERNAKHKTKVKTDGSVEHKDSVDSTETPK